jgi:hypothetical protein
MPNSCTIAPWPRQRDAADRGRLDRHYRAVLSAEVQLLVRELQINGPLTRATLARRCSARNWTEGSLDAAIRAGVRAGALRRRPFDFIDVVREPQDPERRSRVPAGGGRARPTIESAHERASTYRQPPMRDQDGPPEPARARSAPDGAREAEPLIAIMLAVAIPVTLVVLAAADGKIAVLVLAIAAMVAACGALAVFLRRLTGRSSE